MTPFGTWLAEIGLGRYDAVFASSEIDFDVIRSVTRRRPPRPRSRAG